VLPVNPPQSDITLFLFHTFQAIIILRCLLTHRQQKRSPKHRLGWMLNLPGCPTYWTYWTDTQLGNAFQNAALWRKPYVR